MTPLKTHFVTFEGNIVDTLAETFGDYFSGQLLETPMAENFWATLEICSGELHRIVFKKILRPFGETFEGNFGNT